MRLGRRKGPGKAPARGPERVSGLLFVVTTTTAMLSIAPRAAADPGVDQCVEANTEAQSFIRAGKLSAAREQLKACAEISCPGLVRDDCTQRLDQLELAQPTVVFVAKDGDGRDVAAVKVTIDGRPFAVRLEGVALAADPGEHVFVFEMAGAPAVTRRLVLTEGEKGRRELIVLASHSPVDLVARVPAPTESARRERRTGGIGVRRTVALAVLGAGIVSLGAGVAFAAFAKAKADDADGLCGDPCSSAQGRQLNQDARTAGNRASVASIAGATAVAAAAVLWFTAHPSSEGPAVQVGLSGTMIRLRSTW